MACVKRIAYAAGRHFQAKRAVRQARTNNTDRENPPAAGSSGPRLATPTCGSCEPTGTVSHCCDCFFRMTKNATIRATKTGRSIHHHQGIAVLLICTPRGRHTPPVPSINIARVEKVSSPYFVCHLPASSCRIRSSTAARNSGGCRRRPSSGIARSRSRRRRYSARARAFSPSKSSSVAFSACVGMSVG